MILRVALGMELKAFEKAQQRIGALLEADKHRPWWKGAPSVEDLLELERAHQDSEHAFNRLHAWLEWEVKMAAAKDLYQAGPK